MERRLAAIMVADIVGYSRLIRTDEDGTLAALRALHADLISPKIAEHHGRIVKLMGDGLLAEFASVVEAVRAAAELQQAMAERNAGVPEEQRIEFRVGINLGDVAIDGEDIHGDGVNIAARLEALAEPGGIYVSRAVHDQVRDRLELRFEDLGMQRFKNIDRPVRVWRWLRNGTAPTPEGIRIEMSPGGRPSIIVLPFNNMSRDPDQDYFADGITEDIIADLSKVSGLLVAARHSSFTCKGVPAAIQRICRDFDVRYVLEGSVRTADNRVRITAQLIDGVSGRQVWADRYDRELVDIFAIQDEIAHSIADALQVRLPLHEIRAIRKIRTNSIEAYQFYLRGRQYLSRHSAKSYETARRMFQRAIELDPGYAQAYAGIADCDAFRCIMHGDASLENIVAASTKALELDPLLAEAHASRGLTLSLVAEYERASQEFERAISLDPDLYEGHYFWARSCVLQGNHAEAAVHYKRATEVAPEDFQALGHLAQEYHALGRVGEALVGPLLIRTIVVAMEADVRPRDSVTGW